MAIDLQSPSPQKKDIHQTSKDIGPASFNDLMQQDESFRMLFPAMLAEYRLDINFRRSGWVAGTIMFTADSQGHVRLSFRGGYRYNLVFDDNVRPLPWDDQPLVKVAVDADFVRRDVGSWQYTMHGEYYLISYNEYYPDNIRSIEQALVEDNIVVSIIVVTLHELHFCSNPRVNMSTYLNILTTDDTERDDVMARILAVHPEFRPDFERDTNKLLPTGGLKWTHTIWSKKILKAVNLVTRVDIV